MVIDSGLQLRLSGEFGQKFDNVWFITFGGVFERCRVKLCATWGRGVRRALI
jgi:hypothetical protein